MLTFLTPLDTRAYKPGEFVLMHDFDLDVRFGYAKNDSLFRIVVPRGFITDFASVPKTIQAIPGFDVNGQSRDAAIPHDYAYCCGGRVVAHNLTLKMPATLSLTRKQCDQLLYDGLVASGYSKAIAWLFYLGVRIGGGFHWRPDGLSRDYDFAPAEFMVDSVIKDEIGTEA